MSTILREYRKKKKITISDLAEKTGLSTGYISQLERGLVEPSLASLRKIADVLEVSLFSLLEEKPSDTIIVMKSEDQLILQNKEKTILYELLTPLPTDSFVPKSLIIKFTLQPHAQLSNQVLSHPSEELVTMLCGDMVLSIGDETVTLHPGDSGVIRKDLPHNFYNETDLPVVGISVLTPAVWNLNVNAK